MKRSLIFWIGLSLSAATAWGQEGASSGREVSQGPDGLSSEVSGQGLSQATASGRGLTLNECKDLAREHDVDLQNAVLDVTAARYQKQEAFAEYFPSISVRAIAFHALNPILDLGVTDILGHSDMAWNISNAWTDFASQNGIDTRYSALQHGYGVTASLTQPIFAGGRIVNGNRLAALGIEAADLQLELQSRQTETSVEDKYWQVVSLQEKAKTLSQARELLDSLERDVLSGYRAGLLTEDDYLQVRLKSRELQSSEIELTGGTRLAKMDLFNAIGLKYSVVSAVASDESPYIDDILLSDGIDSLQAPEQYYMSDEAAAAQSPESQLLSLQVRSKDLQKRMAVGEALPQVGLGGTYGYGKILGPGSANGALFAMVSVPLTDWGKASRKIKRLEIDRQKALNDQEYMDAQLVLRSRQYWVNLTVAWDRLQVSIESEQIAREAYERASRQRLAGMITVSELLQSQAELRQKEDDRIDASISYRTALNKYLTQ